MILDKIEALQQLDGNHFDPSPDAIHRGHVCQSRLLRTAARVANGCVIPPDSLRGGAQVKVLTALLQRGWIEPADSGHRLAAAHRARGYFRDAAQEAGLNVVLAHDDSGERNHLTAKTPTPDW